MATATQTRSTPHRYGNGWLVPSSTGDQQYLVQRHRFGWSCQCAHFSYRGQRTGTCKHIDHVRSMVLSEKEETCREGR